MSDGSPIIGSCRWSNANSMSFPFCETHSDYHRSFLTPPTICETAKQRRAAMATEMSDISSDLDRHDLAHPTPHYDCPRCLPISSHSVLRDISSDPDEALAYIDDEYLRDISSDPVSNLRHTYHDDLSYPGQCSICTYPEANSSYHNQPGDISSVTGSEAQSFLADLGTDDEFVRRDRNAARIAAIQREAVEPLERQNAELRSALRWVRSHLRYDPPIIRDPEEVARVIDRALLEGKTDE